MIINVMNVLVNKKDVRICKEDFEVIGYMFEKVTIKKGSWWSLVFINNDYILLDGLNGHHLHLKRFLYDLHFENFDYEANT